MFNDKDKQLMASKGITEDVIVAQLKRFETGFPWLKLEAAATVGKGIMRLDAKQQSQCIKEWKEFQSGGASIEKFQPASGAASRMFKNLFAFINEGKSAPETDFEKQFFEGITQFAFYPQLNKTCVSLYQGNVGELIAAGRYGDVIKALLLPEGMNYGSLPKGLLKFHRAAAGTVHTPLEEHLEEGADQRYIEESPLWLLAHIGNSEAGNCDFDEMVKVMSVVMNRVHHPAFPNTIVDVLYSDNPLQYAPTLTPDKFYAEPCETAWQAAQWVLDNGSIFPEDVVYQATFPQGSAVYEYSPWGEYFCYY